VFRKDDPRSKITFEEVVKAVKGDVVLRDDELTRTLGHFRTFDALASRLKDKIVVGHFDFDFANSEHTE